MLPTEVLTAIVDKIDHQKTLFNVLLCSRLFYRVTLPFLYRHIRLIRRTNLERREVVFPNAYDFACRVLRDPHLAAFVTAITIVPSYTTEDLPSFGADEENLDSGILRAIAHDWEGKFKHVKAFRQRRDSEVLVAILLPFLPQLRELHLVTGDVDREAWPHSSESTCMRMLRRMTHTTIFGNPCTAFRHLKHVSLFSRQQGIRYEDLIALYGVANLEKISASNLLPDFWQRRREREKTRFVRTGSSSVTDISITGIRLSPQGIVSFLEPCRTIRAIELVWHNSSIFQTAQAELGWEMMHDALLSAAETLESLTMAYSAATSRPERQDAERFLPLEVLPQLQKLKFLKLGMSFLFHCGDILVAEHAPWNLCSVEAQAISETLAGMLSQQIEELHFVCHEIEHLMVLLLNIRGLLAVVAQGSFACLRSIKLENVRLDLVSPSNRTQGLDLQVVSYLEMEPETSELLLELQHHSQELNLPFEWSTRLTIPEMQ